MKNIIIVATLLIYGVTQAQTEPVDVKEETKTVTTKINDGKSVTEEQVEYTTRKEQEIRLSEDDKNKINQDQVDAPVQVTETVRITSNSPFTEQKKVMHYTIDGEKYMFTMNNEGFLISDTSQSTKTLKVKQSKDEHQFVIDDGGTEGIGYFDDDGNFIVQQFDKNTNKIESKVYKLVK